MPTYEELLQENAELRRRLLEQERRISRLEKVIEELRRGGKRQAAPFSKGEPKTDPQRAGRKPGGQYGLQAVRARPTRVDRRIEVGCPLFCEVCQGRVHLQGKARQYQIDLPAMQPWATEFVLHYGKCLSCGRRVIGRHPQQSSSAVGVGSVQIGPGVFSLAVYLNKVGGLSYGKIAAVLSQMAGLELSRSTLCRAVQRTAKKSRPLYEELVRRVRASPVVYPDETGWRVGGVGAWLWAFTNRTETVYTIKRGRGYAEAVSILGADYPGVLGADGWAPYRRFKKATHQTCLAHLLRRCQELLQTAQAGAARFPRQVQAILRAALAVRDRRLAGTISARGVQIARGHLAARMARLLSGQITHPANRRLANHLRRHQHELFVFLQREDVEATNWPAEQAIRPAVVNRKSGGGNRTPRGADAQAILTSLLRTCHQRGLNAISALSMILRNPHTPSYETLLTSQVR